MRTASGVVAITMLVIASAGGAEPTQSTVELVATVELSGASPEAIERGATMPVEARVVAIPGVVRVRSNSWEGRSQTFIELGLASEPAVRDAVEDARKDFPAGASAPTLVRSPRPSDR